MANLSKSRGVVLVVVVLLFALTGAGVWAYWHFNNTVIEPPAPPPESTKPLALALTPSHISVNVQVSRGSLESRLQHDVPSSYSGQSGEPGHADRKYDYTLNRGPIAVTFDPVHKRIEARANVSGHVQVSDKENAVLTTIKWSVGIDAHGSLRVFASPVVHPDWSIDPAVDIDVSIDDASTMVNAGPIKKKITITGQVRDIVKGKLAEKLQQIRAAIVDQMKFRDKVQPLWAQIPCSARVADDPPTWISLNPKSIGTRSPQYFADRVEWGLASSFDAAAFLAENPPACQTPTLPNLTVTENLPQGFSVCLPVRVSYDVMNQQLAKAIGQNKIEIPKANAWITITKCTIQSHGSGVLVAVDFSGKEGHFRTVSGRLYLTGQPEFDPSKSRLAVTNLKYTAGTNSAIANIANWLAEPFILAELQKACVVDLSGAITEGKKAANDQLARLAGKLPKEVHADFPLTSLELLELRFANEGAFLIVKGGGTVSVSL